MNISGNYSKIKSKVEGKNNGRNKKEVEVVEDNESRYHFSQLYPENRSRQYGEKNQGMRGS